jgi:hypothetical protein
LAMPLGATIPATIKLWSTSASLMHSATV